MRNFFRVLSAFSFGLVLAYNGITFHTWSFWLLVVTLNIYALAWFKD